MPDDEGQLIRLAQQGDAAACTALYDRHYDSVYRYCYLRLGDEVAAQDVAAEVFARMVAGLGRFRARGRPLLAWLYTVARNLIADDHRRCRRAAQVPLEEDLTGEPDRGGDPEQSANRLLTVRFLAVALGALTEEQRLVLVCRFVEGLDNSETAVLMGKSEGAVKALQHRALESLRRALARERWDERGV